MKSNKLVPTVIASAVVGTLVLTGCSQEPSDEFKSRCKKAGGTIERENDFESLGMSSVGFGVPKPPAPAKPAAPAPRVEAPKKLPSAPKAPKVEKLPKNDAPKSDKTKAPRTPSTMNPTPSTNGLAIGKGGKGKNRGGSDDNDFLCVRDGQILFEEDE